jgi:hypothetical protein
MSLADPPPEAPVPLTPAAETFVPDEYDPLRASRLAAPSPGRPDRPMTRTRLQVWLMVGGIVWAIGLAGWLVLAVQGCESDGGTGTAVPKKK